MTAHEFIAMRLLDYGFELPEFADAWPGLEAVGYVERRAGTLHVTGRGRRAYQAWGRRGNGAVTEVIEPPRAAQ